MTTKTEMVEVLTIELDLICDAQRCQLWGLNLTQTWYQHLSHHEGSQAAPGSSLDSQQTPTWCLGSVVTNVNRLLRSPLDGTQALRGLRRLQNGALALLCNHFAVRFECVGCISMVFQAPFLRVFTFALGPFVRRISTSTSCRKRCLGPAIADQETKI